MRSEGGCVASRIITMKNAQTMPVDTLDVSTRAESHGETTPSTSHVTATPRAPRAFGRYARVSTVKSEATPERPSVVRAAPNSPPPPPTTPPALAADWPDPKPLSSMAPPPWPTGAFRGVVERWVTAAAESSQTPMDLAATMALGVISTACGGCFKVHVEGDWIEPTNLYTAVALPPAQRKSAVVKLAREPLDAWERAERERLGPVAEESASVLRAAEKARERAETTCAAAAQKDDSTREKADEARRECVRRVIEARRHLVRTPKLTTADVTPEALTSMLVEQGGRAAILAAEGGGIFDMIAGNRYDKGPNLDVYLAAHAGDDVRVDRKGRESEHISDATLTITVATQPDTLRSLASRPELRGRGLPARFAYSLPASNIGYRRRGVQMPDAVVAEWHDLVTALCRIVRPRGTDGRAAAHILRFDDDALASVQAFADSTELDMRPSRPLAELADWGGKLVGLSVRIAALLHVAEHATAESWETPINLDTTERAIALARDYYVHHARAAFDLMVDTPGLQGARKLLAHIRERSLTTITVRLALVALNRNGTRKDVVDPVFDVLLAHGWIREVPTIHRGPGRPSEVYQIHPSALDPN